MSKEGLSKLALITGAQNIKTQARNSSSSVNRTIRKLNQINLAKPSKENSLNLKRENYMNSGSKRIRNIRQNDISERLKKNKNAESCNNASSLSSEKNEHDGAEMNDLSNSHHSIFSTENLENPQDQKLTSQEKRKKNYFGINRSDILILKMNHNKKKSKDCPTMTFDENTQTLIINDGLNSPKYDPKHVSDVKSLNLIQSKRSSTIETKQPQVFSQTYTTNDLHRKVIGSEAKGLNSLQSGLQNIYLKNFDKEKSLEGNIMTPSAPSKDKASRTPNRPALEHKRPKKVMTEISENILKTESDTNGFKAENFHYSLASIAGTNHSALKGQRIESDYDWPSKHRKLKTTIEKNEISRNASHILKESNVSSQQDVSSSTGLHQHLNVALKAVANNNSNREHCIRKSHTINFPSSESAHNREGLLKRFQEIISYSNKPLNPLRQSFTEKDEHKQSRLTSLHEKENVLKNLKKPQQSESKPDGPNKSNPNVQESRTASMSTDAKIELLKKKIKESELMRKKNKKYFQENEYGLAQENPKNKTFHEDRDNSNIDEEVKKKLLIMRKVQLHDVLIKHKLGKRLPKEALRKLKCEFDKINMDLSELKPH